jgi:hypothetical protein
MVFISEVIKMKEKYYLFTYEVRENKRSEPKMVKVMAKDVISSKIELVKVMNVPFETLIFKLVSIEFYREL